MAGIEQGRRALEEWRADAPSNFSAASPHLARSLEVHAGGERAAAVAGALSSFGADVATVVEPAVATMERHHSQFPRHLAYDGIGRVAHDIEFHPAHAAAGRAVWGSGLLAANRGGRGAFEQAALFYLLSHVGEGGHACPVVCTAGLARAIERRGDTALQEAYLPGLFATDFDECLRGSQFLTEVQGGSDVGANATEAVRDGSEPGAWRLSGEKWFCSVADADLFAVTARPRGADAGTSGLGCFLVPRRLADGTINGFAIRRLKDKLGTRCLASAEIDFSGALGWPIGSLDEGFRVAVEELLDTSRWLNAVGSTGIMRRAYLEASSFARHRRAFGRPLSEFPIVRAQLASMKVDERGALASTMTLTGLLEQRDQGTAEPEARAAHRVLVNANKFVTSLDATDVAHRGIEALGGNGTIEDFSAMPRLYRDAMVYESWEGTLNVLCAQVQRDLSRFELLDPAMAWCQSSLAASGGPREVADALLGAASSLRMHGADAMHGAPGFRDALTRLVRCVQASALLAEAAGGDPEAEGVASLFIERHLGATSWAPSPSKVAAALGGDLD